LEFRFRGSGDMTVKSQAVSIADQRSGRDILVCARLFQKAMSSSAVASVSIAMALAGSTWGQSKISTILGGAPNDLPALSANLNTPSAAACDNSGNVYTVLRGAAEVVRIDSQGIVWLFAGGGSGVDGGPAVSAELGGPAALAVDSTGAVYIVDGNRVRRVGANGIITAFAGTGTAGYNGDGGPALNAEFNSPSAIAFDNSGNLYIADTGNNVIREVTTDGNIKTFAGTGMKTYGGDDGPPLQASFNAPAGVAVDSSGDVYIADTGNNLIREVIASSGLIQRIAGVTTTTGGNSTKAIDATLYGPTFLALDSAGNLYLVEPDRYWVREITNPSGGVGTINVDAGSGTQGFNGDGGVANSSELNVLGIALNSQNELFIADGINNRVRDVTPSNTPGGGVINTLAGNGLASYNPRGLALNGNVLYFSDPANNVVRSFNLSTGQVELVAGTGVAGSAGDTGPAINATLKMPMGLALDSAGDLFIADSANNRIREVTASGSFLGLAAGAAGDINTVAGSNNLLTSGSTIGDGGAATSAILEQPYGVAVDQSGNLYIAERTGQRIREVNTAGIINTVAGTGASGVPTSATGPALSQPLNYPQGLAIEPSGSLLIADTSNNLIRRYSNGTLTTVAGTTAGYGGDGGPATSAMLQSPEGVAEDSNGNIYIADSSNEVIRWVGSDGIINTIAGMTGHAGYDGDGSPATAYELNTPFAVAPLPSCTLAVADSQNQRLRQVWPAVTYTINATITNAPGASNLPAPQVMVDGQLVTAPYTVGWLPGSQHMVSAPSSQTAGSLETETQYTGSGSSQTINVSCGPAFGPPIAVNFQAQYELTIVSDDGGSVSAAAQWQSPGAKITLTETANTGYVFTGWEGACTGQGACQVVMNGPESVKADFAPAQTLSPSILPGGIAGAGASVPPVTALSPNGFMSIYGSNFAPAGTAKDFASAMVNGQVSTELDGVCVMVGSTPAPVIFVSPGQINFQVPQITGSQSAPVQVVTGCNTANSAQSNAVNVAVQSAAPEFLHWISNANGIDPIAATDFTSGTCVGSAGLLPGCVDGTFAPVKPGDILTLYAIGFGATSPAFAPGTVPTTAAQVTGSVQISIGSTNLPESDIQYVGISPDSVSGLYQVNVQVPASIASGNQPVQITINGVSSPSGAYITIGQ
jgi:uncharacterized protein (TIGR03437 family)